jgi:enoyl-CoA hydratase/carnithine racemase
MTACAWWCWPEGKAFCAGHNLKDMAAHPELAWYQQLFAQCSRMMLSIHKLPVPVIARVQGMATAAGCQLVAQCDLAVAADNASFATSGIHYGLFCATPSVPLVRNVPAKRAMEMLLTGDFHRRAHRAGARPGQPRGAPDALDAEVEKLVQSIVQKPRAAVAMGKALVYQQRELGLEAAYQLAGQTMAANMMDGAAQEGARAFAEKRKPAWKADPVQFSSPMLTTCSSGFGHLHSPRC